MKKLYFFFVLFLGLSVNLSKAKTYNEEVIEALDFLQKVPVEERVYIKFFSTISIPEMDLRIQVKSENEEEDKLEAIPMKEAVIKVLDFWVHSMSAGFNFVDFIPVSDTLVAIDIRNYGWTPEAWEKVAVLDPYYREPWIDGKTNTQLRLQSGNAILRADWFIVHTSDVTKQLDRDITFFPYYELLYAKSGIPKNNVEFRKAWGFDYDKVKTLQILTGSVVDTGDSEVATHNRQLTRSRSEVGYYWETSDVKNTILGRDYLENLDPSIREKDVDAGEGITNNKVGLQVYMLFDQDGNRIEFASNGIATDKTDARDKRVRTAKSCVICHPRGINHTSNAITELALNGASLKAADIETRNLLRKFYFGKINTLIDDDQTLYERAVYECNGLNPEDNARLFKEVIEWYGYKITDTQAAFECGVTIEEFREKIKPTVSGRLAGLINNKPIPREVWEEVQNGAFGQAMLLVHGLKQDIQQKESSVEVPKPEPSTEGMTQPVEIPKVMITVISDTDLKLGEEILAQVPADTVLELLADDGVWCKVSYEGQNGYILKTDTRVNN